MKLFIRASADNTSTLTIFTKSYRRKKKQKKDEDYTIARLFARWSKRREILGTCGRSNDPATIFVVTRDDGNGNLHSVNLRSYLESGSRHREPRSVYSARRSFATRKRGSFKGYSFDTRRARHVLRSSSKIPVNISLCVCAENVWSFCEIGFAGQRFV